MPGLTLRALTLVMHGHRYTDESVSIIKDRSHIRQCVTFDGQVRTAPEPRLLAFHFGSHVSITHASGGGEQKEGSDELSSRVTERLKSPVPWPPSSQGLSLAQAQTSGSRPSSPFTGSQHGHQRSSGRAASGVSSTEDRRKDFFINLGNGSDDGSLVDQRPARGQHGGHREAGRRRAPYSSHDSVLHSRNGSYGAYGNHGNHAVNDDRFSGSGARSPGYWPSLEDTRNLSDHERWMMERRRSESTGSRDLLEPHSGRSGRYFQQGASQTSQGAEQRVYAPRANQSRLGRSNSHSRVSGHPNQSHVSHQSQPSQEQQRGRARSRAVDQPHLLENESNRQSEDKIS